MPLSIAEARGESGVASVPEHGEESGVPLTHVRFKGGPRGAGSFGMQSNTRTEILGPNDMLPSGRRFADATGCVWSVYERTRQQLIGGPVTVLVFDSMMAFRCVRTYPISWQDRSAAELEHLSWQK